MQISELNSDDSTEQFWLVSLQTIMTELWDAVCRTGGDAGVERWETSVTYKTRRAVDDVKIQRQAVDQLTSMSASHQQLLTSWHHRRLQ